MQFRHIDIESLTLSSANMRAKGKPDIANILPSIRARGILVPLIVRPSRSEPKPAKPCDGEDGAAASNAAIEMFEIVAGKRRFHAALAIAEENGGEPDPLPCAILDDTDDAAALEASLIENVARLDPDEVSRWECFTRLVKEGRSPEDIALTFGLTDLQVKRTLALGNLTPRIRHLYRDEQIDAATVRHLTLASKAQQKEWLAMLDDPETYCPTGSQLKAWLFGGMSIPASAAIFDLAAFDGDLVSDLFGEDRYFASAEVFWTAQRQAVEAKAEAYREAGWSDVIVLEPNNYFHTWEHEKRAKGKGGKVFIAVSHRGDVTTHEGYVSLREARRREMAESGEKPKRPELTAPLHNYIDLHRHAVVRTAVAADSSLALRLVLAHAICGSGLWSVRVEPQRALTDAIAESVETAPCEALFDERRRAILDRLGFDSEAPTVTGGYDGATGISGLFVHLLALSDEAILDALAIVMAETIEAGTDLIETLGQHLKIDMADHYAVDGALLDLVKDRELLDAMVSEIAGEAAAQANVKATGTVKRQIIADCLTGENGRAKVERFVPRWMTFPPSAYTSRGGVGPVERAERIAGAVRPQPEARDAAPSPTAHERMSGDSSEAAPVAGIGKDARPFTREPNTEEELQAA